MCNVLDNLSDPQDFEKTHMMVGLDVGLIVLRGAREDERGSPQSLSVSTVL